MGITTKDLAQLCGVSRTTVHRALNGIGRIHPDTREMILQTARDNGYRPDLLARGLVKGQTLSIGVVVLDVKNRYFSQMLSAIGAQANQRGYCVNITLHDNSREQEREQLARLADYRVDGIIVSSVNEGAQYKQFLEQLDVPLVSVDNRIAEGIPFVGINQKNAMQEAAKKVLEKGYQKIVFVCPPMAYASKENVYVHRERLSGFREAVKGYADIKTQELLDWSYLEQAEKLLDTKEKTAFLCTADDFALELMKRFRSKGKRAPEDYGIVGFDNIDTLEYVYPRMSTISNAVNEVADAAVNLLFELMEEKQQRQKASNKEQPEEHKSDAAGKQDILLPYAFIPGETI